MMALLNRFVIHGRQFIQLSQSDKKADNEDQSWKTNCIYIRPIYTNGKLLSVLGLTREKCTRAKASSLEVHIYLAYIIE